MQENLHWEYVQSQIDIEQHLDLDFGMEVDDGGRWKAWKSICSFKKIQRKPKKKQKIQKKIYSIFLPFQFVNTFCCVLFTVN